MTGLLGSGIGFPLAVDQRGALALARGDEDVAQAIGVVLATAPGERPMRPEFGCRVHEHIFDQLDPETLARIEVAIREALARWEPRIDLEDIDFDLDEADEGELHVHLTYRLRETGSVRNLVHPFYLIPDEDGP